MKRSKQILEKFDSFVMKRKVNENFEEDQSLDHSGEVYIGTKLMGELADRLGTTVVDNAINYKGKTINFFSETEKFHIGKDKFTTVDEVVDFLTHLGETTMEGEPVLDNDPMNYMTPEEEAEGEYTMEGEPVEESSNSKKYRKLQR